MFTLKKIIVPRWEGEEEVFWGIRMDLVAVALEEEHHHLMLQEELAGVLVGGYCVQASQ